MDDDEVVIDLTAFPREGLASTSKVVTFGPVSDKFAFLIEIDPETGQIDVTIGNSPAVSQLPTFIPEMLMEVGEQIASIAERADFLEFVYGSPDEDDDDD